MPDVMWYARSRAANVRLYDGSASAPSLAFANQTNTGLHKAVGNAGMTLTTAGVDRMHWFSTDVRLSNDQILGWSTSGTDPENNAPDTTLSRAASQIIKVTKTFNFTGPTTTGANTATMTNSPTTGNPSGWLIVQLEGASRYIPLWS